MPKVILSTHAIDRAKLRKMELYGIEKLVLNPDKKISLGQNKFKFLKKIGDRRYQAIASYLPKENNWLVISVWVRGEDDRVPLIWQIITLPFRLLWWILKFIWQIIAKIA